MLHSNLKNPKLPVTVNFIKQDIQLTTFFEDNTRSFCNDWSREKKLLCLVETLNLKVFSKCIEGMDPILLYCFWTDFVTKGKHDIPTKQTLCTWNMLF